MENYNELYNYMMDTYGQLPVVFMKGEKSTLYDSEGKSYIDFASGVGVNSLGYGDEDWKKAIKDQLNNLAHTSNIYYNAPSLKLAKKLTEKSNMDKVFFANSGAEANETAIKIARKYSYEKYGEGRSTIITLKKSFHGRTMATITATGQEKFHNYFFPFLEGFKYIEANSYESFLEAIDPSVCAIMLEAIQGEGGVIPLEDEFVQKVALKCKENDILLIMDEVQCGIGRTGLLFGFNHFDIKPDIITVVKGLASGLPISAALANKKLSNVLKIGDHGCTFGGNALSSAAALTVLDKVSDKGFLEKVSHKEKVIKDFFKDNDSFYIKEVRGKGLMIGLEIEGEASLIQKRCLEKGLLVLTAGPNVVRLLPPLVIEENTLKEGLEILHTVLKENIK